MLSKFEKLISHANPHSLRAEEKSKQMIDEFNLVWEALKLEAQDADSLTYEETIAVVESCLHELLLSKKRLLALFYSLIPNDLIPILKNHDKMDNVLFVLYAQKAVTEKINNFEDLEIFLQRFVGNSSEKLNKNKVDKKTYLVLNIFAFLNFNNEDIIFLEKTLEMLNQNQNNQLEKIWTKLSQNIQESINFKRDLRQTISHDSYISIHERYMTKLRDDLVAPKLNTFFKKMFSRFNFEHMADQEIQYARSILLEDVPGFLEGPKQEDHLIKLNEEKLDFSHVDIPEVDALLQAFSLECEQYFCMKAVYDKCLGNFVSTVIFSNMDVLTDLIVKLSTSYDVLTTIYKNAIQLHKEMKNVRQTKLIAPAVLLSHPLKVETQKINRENVNGQSDTTENEIDGKLVNFTAKVQKNILDVAKIREVKEPKDVESEEETIAVDLAEEAHERKASPAICKAQPNITTEELIAVPKALAGNARKIALRIASGKEDTTISYQELNTLAKALGSKIDTGDGSRRSITTNSGKIHFHERHKRDRSKYIDPNVAKSMRGMLESLVVMENIVESNKNQEAEKRKTKLRK